MNTKRKPDLIVIPYRDQYFFNEYGLAVRDLQFIKSILDIGCFESIRVINRPVSLYERLLGKLNKDLSVIPGVDFIDATSLDLIGPLYGRAWAKSCFSETIKTLTSEYVKGENKVVVLDFSPFAIYPLIKNSNILYWYDLIDNFTKHNRYTSTQKKLVHEKYTWVNRNFTMVTGVTNEALASFGINKTVLPNGVFFNEPKKNELTSASKIFDFGFIGFITDKLDLAFVKKLSANYSVAIYGTCLDKKILQDIKKMNNVYYFGKFQYAEIETITKTFKIGILPYLKEKSHDESPLKLYEYFKHNLPCVSSTDYEIQSKFIINYNKTELSHEKIQSLKSMSGDSCISASIHEDWHIKSRLTLFINEALVKFPLPEEMPAQSNNRDN
jgi:hypothetical protein